MLTTFLEMTYSIIEVITMEIALFYSKENSDHLKAANLVKKAVKNLGISATITERDVQMPDPQIIVNGFVDSDFCNSHVLIYL